MVVDPKKMILAPGPMCSRKGYAHIPVTWCTQHTLQWNCNGDIDRTYSHVRFQSCWYYQQDPFPHSNHASAMPVTALLPRLRKYWKHCCNLFYFIFFHAELILNSQRGSKYGIESSSMPFAQLPCMVTSCITMVKRSSEPWYTILLAEWQILFGISIFPLMSFICCIWWSRVLTLLQSGSSSVPPCLFWLLKGSSQGFETVVCLSTVVQSS